MRVQVYYFLPLFLALLATTCNGQKFSPGACRANLMSTVTPAGLTFTSLAAVWRETARTKSALSHGWRCVTYTITTVTANVQYNVVISGRKKITNTPVTVSGVIDVTGTVNMGVSTATTALTFTLNFPGITKSAKYFIIFLNAGAADALALYSCQDVAFGKIESAIFLTKPVTTAASIDAGVQALNGLGFPANKLSFNFQDDCAII